MKIVESTGVVSCDGIIAVGWTEFEDPDGGIRLTYCSRDQVCALASSSSAAADDPYNRILQYV